MTKIATAEERKQQDNNTVSKGSGSGFAILEKEKQFTPWHRCASRTLQVLLTFADMVKSSPSSMEGFMSNHIMRLKGILGREEIIVLIDCGSSNNLISPDLVKRLGITTTNTSKPLGVTLPTGETVCHQGICKGVIISFPGLKVTEDYLPFKMGHKGYDVILGIKWLKTLGDVMMNLHLYTMTFVSETGKVTLKGDPELCSSSRVPAKSKVDKRSKGMCFTCDQKFSHGHRCASCTLQVMLTFADMVKSSPSSVEDFMSNHIMRLKGILGVEEIIVLIDFGSSNNLISTNLVQRLGIATETNTVSPLGCTLATGENVCHQGICKGVVISFRELQVVEDFLPFKMGHKRYDVILGIKWLKTLGDFMVNWQLYTMTFVNETGKITLKGDPELCSSSRVPAKSKADNHR